MNFYFNIDENMCADEETVIEYLCKNEGYERGEAEEELHYCREVNGWYSCEVSKSIEDKFFY